MLLTITALSVHDAADYNLLTAILLGCASGE